MDAIRNAVLDEGPNPAYHRAMLARHRREWPTLWQAIDAILIPKVDMPDGITVDGHLFVHVAACPCPRIQREVARLAPHAPDREIGYTAFECEREMKKLGGRCADPEAH